MGPRVHRQVRLFGGGLPGLNLAELPYRLKEDESPEAYGIDLTYDGEVVAGTVPTGTARLSPAVTLSEGGSDIPYLWYYNRLWNITGRTAAGTSNVLIYGARNYQHYFLPQRLGKLMLDGDTDPILALLPVAPDALFVAKASGGFLVNNLTDARAFFSLSEFYQEMATPAANQAVTLDTAVFVTNAVGMTALEGGKTVEVSRKIRTETLTGSAVTADYKLRRVIVGSTHVYDIGLEKWFKYSGSSFRLTTRELVAADWSPFAVDRVIFVLRHLTSADGSLSYQVRYEGGAWQDEQTVLLPYTPGKYTTCSETLKTKLSASRFQLRVTSLSGVALREILVESDVKQMDDYKA